MVQNATGIVIAFLFLTIPGMSIAQKGGLRKPLMFVAKKPDRGDRPVTPSGFISLIDLRKIEQPTCEYSFGSIQFRVLKSGKIDSVSITGTVFASIKPRLIEQVRKSAPYWKCADCKKEGYWVTAPIFITTRLVARMIRGRNHFGIPPAIFSTRSKNGVKRIKT